MTLARRVYRLVWWPTRTRRERWIWRYGYVWGVVSALYHYRRVFGQTQDSRSTECPECSNPDRLYALWKQRTGHTGYLTVANRALCEPFIARYGFETVDRAIAGIAYDPYSKGTRVWNNWEFLFRSPDRFEDYANRAPRNWKPSRCEKCHRTKEEHAL